MLVAQVRVHERRGEVEDAAVARVDPAPLTAGDDERRDRALRRPRDEHVVLRVLRDPAEVDAPLGLQRHEASNDTPG
jgi:hypothetical protein